MTAQDSAELLERSAPGPAARRGPSAAARVALSAGLLLLVYIGLSFINDSAATLGADEGAKVATLKVMGERGTFVPDVPYWAAQWDPNGTYHGLYYTTRIGDAYVNVTTLPMILLAKPLWDVAGYRGALLLPMLGGVASALAARALARRLAPAAHAARAGEYAFWLVGLASPVTIYALDLWEHTLGLAAMAWGVVFLVEAAGIVTGAPADVAVAPSRGSTARWALASGACFGLAASMRTEAIAYLLITVVVAAFAVGFPRRWVRPIVLGASALAGFTALFLANAALEVGVLGASIRSGRAAGAAGAGGQDVGGRAREGVTTLLALAPSSDGVYLLYGLIFAVAVAMWALAAAGKLPRVAEVVGIAVAVLVVLQRMMDGTGFWPGLLATTPLAAVGLALAWRRPSAWVAVMAIAPLPVVFAFQFPGGALPQWGGRYILLTGLLLSVVGIVALVQLPRSSRLGLAGLAVVVTGIGLGWSSQRTHAYAEAGDLLAARPEDVLISPDAFPPREFGSTWGAKNWLATVPSDIEGAVDVARRSGARSFALVELDGTRPLPAFAGFHETGRSQIPITNGGQFTVVGFAAD